MTTMTIPARRPLTRRWQVAVVGLVATVATSLPAAAESPQHEPGPGDLQQAEAEPHLDVEPSCNPDGFHYEMVHPDAPEGAVYAGEWREAPAGDPNPLPFNQPSGFVASGTGDFQVRGVVVNQGVPIHEYDWEDVTVFCPGFVPRPAGDPEVTIDVEPTCDPDAGLTYEVHVQSPPDGNTATKAQWRPLGGQVTTVDGASNTLAVGEGTFEIRGVLHHQGPGFYASDWAEVEVDCTEPGDDPGEEPGDDDDDRPRPGTPTFTG